MLRVSAAPDMLMVLNTHWMWQPAMARSDTTSSCVCRVFLFPSKLNHSFVRLRE